MKNTQIHRGAVFYVDLGQADGTSVQAGIRPAVIVSNEKANTFSSVISICGISTRVQTKAKIPTHVFLSAQKTGLNRDSICLCEQPLSISKDMLLEYITTLSEDDMERVSDGLRIQLSL